MKKRRKDIPKSIKITLKAVANNRCEYCKSPKAFSTELFTNDHIIPLSKNGTNDMENLAYSCSGCNTFKHDKVEAYHSSLDKIFPLFNPRRQKWSEHFSWNNDFTQIIPLTPIGQVTIEQLKLNREQLQNLRRVLVIVSKHPPIE